MTFIAELAVVEETTAIAESKESDAPTNTCGQCNNIRYTGFNAVEQKRGTCQKYSESGRATVGRDEIQCLFWTPRTPARVAADQKAMDKSRGLINDVNRSLPRKRS